MRYLILLFLFNLSYAKTMNIEMGSNDIKNFEWISLNKNEIFVQELKTKDIDLSNEEYCLFKGLDISKSNKDQISYQKNADYNSVRLLRWHTPEAGKLTRPKPIKTMTAFKETKKSGRCPELDTVPRDLVSRVENFQNVEQIEKPFSYVVYSGEKNVTDFTGSCFVNPKDNKGCQIDKRFDFNTKP